MKTGIVERDCALEELRRKSEESVEKLSRLRKENCCLRRDFRSAVENFERQNFKLSEENSRLKKEHVKSRKTKRAWEMNKTDLELVHTRSCLEALLKQNDESLEEKLQLRKDNERLQEDLGNVQRIFEDVLKKLEKENSTLKAEKKKLKNRNKRLTKCSRKKKTTPGNAELAQTKRCLEMLRKKSNESVEELLKLKIENKTLYSHLKEREDSRDCIICMENVSTHCFQCGHRACEACGKELKECHVCRRPVEIFHRVFDD